MTLLGANWNVDPNTGVRGPETILRPATDDPSYADVMNSNTLMRIMADGVVIKGFTLTGENTTFAGAAVRDGADINAGSGIANEENFAPNNLLVENNILKSLYFGVSLYNVPATPSSGNLITNNRFENFDSDDDNLDYGIAVLLYNNAYAGVTNNVMTDATVGIQTGNFHLADPTLDAADRTFSGNTITTDGAGIFHNLHYSGASAFTISGNNISKLAGSSDVDGILIWSIQSGVSVNVLNNNVTGADTGIGVWNTPTTANILIEGGTLDGNGIGVHVYEQQATYGTGASADVTIKGTVISNSTVAAVSIDDSPPVADRQSFVSTPGIRPRSARPTRSKSR